MDSPSSSHEESVIKDLLKQVYKQIPTRWQLVAKDWCGVSEETTTGVHRLYQMLEQGKLLVPAIDVSPAPSPSPSSTTYTATASRGRRHQACYGRRLVAGKVVVCGYGDVSKAQPLRCANSAAPRVMVTEIDPINALQAAMEGATRSPPSRRRSAAATSTSAPPGNVDIITLDHMKLMKDQAIVCNIGHFDNEIQMEKLNADKGVTKLNIKPQVDKYTFSNGSSIFVLAEGHTSSTWAAPPATPTSSCPTASPTRRSHNSISGRTRTPTRSASTSPKKLDERSRIPPGEDRRQADTLSSASGRTFAACTVEPLQGRALPLLSSAAPFLVVILIPLAGKLPHLLPIPATSAGIHRSIYALSFLHGW